MGFLSDIHGNLEALQAVLDELEQESIREIFVAGDLLYGGDAPLEVWKRLQEVEAKCVRGLSDTALCLVDPKTLVAANPNEEIMARRFAETRRKLGDLVIERLRRLPERLRIPLIDGSEIVLVHGSPADPSTEVSHDMSDEELLSLVGDDPADIIVCGGSHVPFQRILPETVLANVGSVGSAPGGRHAHYTVITPRMDGAAIEQRYLSLSKRRS
ncbi:MAG: metallophosphoesterase family protein [Myxococcales bacterium]|nr:metallophosphoesterase family protein [Myxococcales bacterium]